MTVCPPVLFILGPTASEKSRLASWVADQVNAELINADSVAMYRDLLIGTAKPSLAEQIRHRYHLLDLLPLHQTGTAFWFCQALDQLLHAIYRRQRLPVVVGGSLFYLNSWFSGLAHAHQPSAPDSRRRWEELAETKGLVYLWQYLLQLDKQAPQQMHASDQKRIIRALERLHQPKRMTSSCHHGQTVWQPVVWIRWPDREILHHRIEQRWQTMLHQGLCDEVAELYLRGDLHLGLPALKAIGYRHLWLWMQNQYDLKEASAQAVIATRQLAKRQFTWLRRYRSQAFVDDQPRFQEENWYEPLKRLRDLL